MGQASDGKALRDLEMTGNEVTAQQDRPSSSGGTKDESKRSVAAHKRLARQEDADSSGEYS